VFAKPYSVDREALARLTKAGHDVIQQSYEEYEKPGFLDSSLKEALERSREDGKRTAILEVGGYFADPLLRLSESLVPYLVGVVEDTTFGHNRYKKVIEKVPVPVFSVARTQLKEIEARFVGKDAVAAVERLLRQRGVSISGRVALVIGYGMIGSNVARALAGERVNFGWCPGPYSRCCASSR
jgi:adenosylhomocysteinase